MISRMMTSGGWPVPPLGPASGRAVASVLVAFVAALPAPPAGAGITFTDVTGPRFPIELGQAEKADLGDVDGDGDLDIIVACGGDFGPQPDRLFLNGGTGCFIESPDRLPAVPSASRDVELGDVDGDGDLDAMIAADFGTGSYLLVNLGGMQGGQPGFFGEETLARFGTALPSWSEDADFADVDSDGDLDVLLTSHGESSPGGWTALWLNNGNGVFTDGTARLGLTDPLEVVDALFLDVDADFDLDLVLACRRQPSRLLLNQNGTFAMAPNGSLPADGPATYDIAAGDLTGDGRAELYVVNFDVLADAVLAPDGGGGFTNLTAVLLGDSSRLDENQANFGDIDGDGDLDCVLAGWVSRNRILVNDGSGRLMPDPTALPASGVIPGATLDAEFGDVDNDGRLDIFLAVSGLVPHDRLLRNVNAPPDAVPPTIGRLRVIEDTSAPGPYPVVAEIRDNLLAVSAVLTYTVNEGAPQTVHLRPLTGTGDGLGGTGLLRADIPAAAPGSLVKYRITAQDRRGNTQSSSEVVFHVLEPTAVAEVPGAPADRLNVTPNPISASGILHITLTRPAPARVAIYDLAGRCVRTLLDAERPAGTATLDWDGRGDSGALLPRGVYFVEFQTAHARAVRKVQLIR